ncbi:OsmC family protein [Sorangium sp. So ce341]|uniref:OsmC family protein n=1 Tax=Sorangium sp. So ce341 TaxID=3133302 RepID=UPI003F609F07
MAKMTLSGETTWSGEGTRAEVRLRNHRLIVDEPPELGGKNEGPNPVELLLGGLGSCLTVLASLYAPTYGVDLRGFRVRVDGDLDPDGFQEKAPVRPGFLEIRCHNDVDSPSPAENVQALVAHIRRICPVRDTLAGVPARFVAAGATSELPSREEEARA